MRPILRRRSLVRVPHRLRLRRIRRHRLFRRLALLRLFPTRLQRLLLRRSTRSGSSMRVLSQSQPPPLTTLNPCSIQVRIPYQSMSRRFWPCLVPDLSSASSY